MTYFNSYFYGFYFWPRISSG